MFEWPDWMIDHNVSVCASLQGHVVMGAQAVSPYQQVIEKTKGLAFRSQMLVMNIEKKIGSEKKEVIIICYSFCSSFTMYL